MRSPIHYYGIFATGRVTNVHAARANDMFIGRGEPQSCLLYTSDAADEL